jgi:hypothetical protein
VGALDLKKELPDYFKVGTRDFALVTLPAYSYLVVDGEGDPNHSLQYAEAIELLFTVAYTLKFLSKSENDFDYVVPPLEGLWWASDPRSFARARKDDWKWTMMIMVPAAVPRSLVARAKKAVLEKRPELDLSKVRQRSLREGLSVQILHVGPYDAEGPTLARMHGEFMAQHGLAFNGKHHEIYLSDARRSSPEKLRTILRQPVKRTLRAR